MKHTDLPKLICSRLPDSSRDSWETTVAALRDAQACPLRQAWFPQPQEAFRPANVRTGWTDSDLIVLAELEDGDIFNPITELNAMAFQHGDVFEMFLRPTEQAAYCEFHVSPRNQKLQLRFPSLQAFRTPRVDPGIPPAWITYDRQITSQVRIEPERNRWSVLATIPVNMVADSGRVSPGSRWLFSFSRYDYTQGHATPVLSSTSPHREVNFHRQEEWGTLLFK
jgi:hypothetical protein